MALYEEETVPSAVHCGSQWLLYCRHLCFRNLNSTFPINVVRVQSYVKSLFNFSRVPMLLVCSERNLKICQSLSSWKPYISLLCILICSCMHFPVFHYFVIFVSRHNSLHSFFFFSCFQMRPVTKRRILWNNLISRFHALNLRVEKFFQFLFFLFFPIKCGKNLAVILFYCHK